MGFGQADRDPRRPVYVISVAAGIVSVHPRTLRIYEEEGLVVALGALPFIRNRSTRGGSAWSFLRTASAAMAIGTVIAVLASPLVAPLLNDASGAILGGATQSAPP